MSHDWADVPAHMRSIARRLDHHRRTMLLSMAAVWVAFFSLFFSLGERWSHAHAIAIVTVAPLAFVLLWAFSVRAWFVRLVPASPSRWSRANGWFQSLLLVLFGAVLATMSWGFMRMFLRV
jgi:hypothetical protein